MFPPLQTTAGLASLPDIFPILFFAFFPHCGAWSQAIVCMKVIQFVTSMDTNRLL